MLALHLTPFTSQITPLLYLTYKHLCTTWSIRGYENSANSFRSLHLPIRTFGSFFRKKYVVYFHLNSSIKYQIYTFTFLHMMLVRGDGKRLNILSYSCNMQLSS